MFGSFLPSLWSLSNQSLLGSRSRHCYAIKWIAPKHLSGKPTNRDLALRQLSSRGIRNTITERSTMVRLRGEKSEANGNRNLGRAFVRTCKLGAAVSPQES